MNQRRIAGSGAADVTGYDDVLSHMRISCRFLLGVVLLLRKVWQAKKKKRQARKMKRTDFSLRCWRCRLQVYRAVAGRAHDSLGATVDRTPKQVKVPKRVTPPLQPCTLLEFGTRQSIGNSHIKPGKLCWGDAEGALWYRAGTSSGIEVYV